MKIRRRVGKIARRLTPIVRRLAKRAQRLPILTQSRTTGTQIGQMKLSSERKLLSKSISEEDREFREAVKEESLLKLGYFL